MGLDVAVQDEGGKQLHIVLDERNLVSPLIGFPSFSVSPMLASVDRYGDTVFNRVQIRQFIVEWSELARNNSMEGEQKIANEILALAELVRDSVHLYLVFIGD
ncbi:hypothetical protein [Granulicella sibirica]|nr:hypothetical protein [Granulicella sibirica]